MRLMRFCLSYSFLAAVFSVLVIMPTISAAESPDSSELAFRPPMHSLYQSLVAILDFTLLDSDKVKSQDLKITEQQLKNISVQAKSILELAHKGDKGREFFANELVKVSELAYLRFKSGHNSQAKYYLGEVVATCFGCHTSRTSTRDSDFSKSLSRDVDLSRFDPLAKARFLVLSRQFESAETEYEKIILSESGNLDEMINSFPVVEYLVLTLRVKSDFKRSIDTLSKMAHRNYPQVVKRDLLIWIDSLKSVEKQKSTDNLLESSRLVIQQAKSKMEYPRDRSGIVYFIVASKMLEEYLKQGNLSNFDRANAYYELGSCENVISHDLSNESAVNYFEQSVRLSPKSDLAKKAFARYEENVIYGYSGSSGMNIPVDEKAKMENLRAIAY